MSILDEISLTVVNFELMFVIFDPKMIFCFNIVRANVATDLLVRDEIAPERMVDYKTDDAIRNACSIRRVERAGSAVVYRSATMSKQHLMQNQDFGRRKII